MATAPDRQERITRLLRERGHVSVADLSDLFDVSEVTIRKDLQALEQKSLLYRTHGGAHLRNPHVSDRPLSEKAAIRAEEKDRIGRAAAAHIRATDSIILASGTTTGAVARHLPASIRSLTVVTSAMNVAIEMAGLPGVETLMLGGIVRPTSNSVVGPQAEAILETLTCDKLFLGVDALDLSFGLSTTNPLEASLNRAMMRAAGRVIVLADSSKFGRRSFSRICSPAEVDCVITDGGVSSDTVEALREVGVTVEVV